MKVIWSEFAAETLQEIYVYYKETTGKIIANRIKETIFFATNQLVKYPNSGQIEDNLTILGEAHWFLVIGNYKIIYKAVKEGVLVTDVFDTRQDPRKINVNRRKSNR